MLSEAVNDLLQSSQAHNYAARYHAQEQRHKIEMQRAYIKRGKAVIMIVALVLVARKCQTATTRPWEGKGGQPVATEHPAAAASPEAMSPAELFQFLSRVILDEQLFLDPDFDRQSAIDRFHLSNERIGAAFAQGSSYGLSATEFRKQRKSSAQSG